MHTIRLRGPWLVVREGQSATFGFPANWQSIQDQLGPGAIQLVRRFGLPTGIDLGDILTLVIDSQHFIEAAALNGRGLGSVAAGESTRFDVTAQLSARNELMLSAQLPTDASPEMAAANVAEVRLEIAQAGAAIS